MSVNLESFQFRVKECQNNSEENEVNDLLNYIAIFPQNPWLSILRSYQIFQIWFLCNMKRIKLNKLNKKNLMLLNHSMKCTKIMPEIETSKYYHDRKSTHSLFHT